MNRCLNMAGLFLSLLTAASGYAADSSSGPAELLPVVQAQATALEAVSDNAAAVALFAAKIGPALGLHDVASTLAAKNIPPKIAKELGVQELAASAQRLVADLAAWQTADRVMQTLSEPANPIIAPAATSVAWIQTAASIPSLALMTKEFTQTAEPKADAAAADRTTLALSAGRLALDAQQRAIAEWWHLKTWKDRVRTVRGRNKLCGTWQWIIHNHQQHHQEQKLAILLPPPGADYPLPPGLVETVVLGENVYLRWESNGQIQEDSLQFTKEGKGLEGTFVNSQGGWGSISGKRTSDCKP
ncbi:MAG: Flagellar hook-associated protein flgK [Nitrospira sp.]|nr:MAG: Flagellar hook-associated protein flgK [Nitrospira sp.]